MVFWLQIHWFLLVFFVPRQLKLCGHGLPNPVGSITVERKVLVYVHHFSGTQIDLSQLIYVSFYLKDQKNTVKSEPQAYW